MNDFRGTLRSSDFASLVTSSDFTLGVDLGGTKIEAVALRKGSTDVLARRRVLTEREEGYDAILERTATLIEATALEARLDLKTLPVGVGMPGNIRRDGTVKNSNTTCLNGRHFREDLIARLGRPIVFDNDANCFVLAEVQLGAARVARDGVVFGIIMGTGVGGGVVIRGRVWPGLQGIAGEWGHHPIGAWRAGSDTGKSSTGSEPGRPCYCGHTGCVEQYLSGPAVEADYAKRSGSSRSLAEIVKRRALDKHARAALEELLESFGRGVANVIDILDPSVIVLGGGVSNLDMLYNEGRERVAKYLFNDELATPILENQLGDSAGVLGAALLPLGIDA